MKKFLVMAALAITFFSPTSFAEEAATSTTPTAPSQSIPVDTRIPQNIKEYYDYTSAEYGYSLKCAWKPIVVDLKFEDPPLRGEQLFFLNSNNEVVFRYRIVFDAFNDSAVPDFNTSSEDVLKDYLEKFKKANRFELAEITNISRTNKGAFGITGKEIEVPDENGNVTTSPASNQAAVTFFRHNGQRMMLMVIADDLTREMVNAYGFSVSTFQTSDAKKSSDNKKSSDTKDNKKSSETKKSAK